MFGSHAALAGCVVPFVSDATGYHQLENVSDVVEQRLDSSVSPDLRTAGFPSVYPISVSSPVSYNLAAEVFPGLDLLLASYQIQAYHPE